MDTYLFSDDVMRILRYVLVAIGIVLAVIVFIVTPLTHMTGVAQGEGEIVEISSLGITVMVQHANYLGMNESIVNPVGNITAGICSEQINQYSRCSVGTKVRVSKYMTAIADWWSIDALIKSYSNVSDTFIAGERENLHALAVG
jgi:hypothetical protein